MVRVAAASLAASVLLAPNVASAQSGRARVLIVSGVAGEPQYADVFFEQATTMIDALKTRFSVPARTSSLAESVARRDADQAASTKEHRAGLTALGARCKTGDVLFMLIGHGGRDATTSSSTSRVPTSPRPTSRACSTGLADRPSRS
jgi:mRNA-degrading endonuclease toxin of MazEF toxin-antitoxin module